METLVHFTPMLLQGFIGSFLLFTVLWVIQVIRRDAGVVDIGGAFCCARWAVRGQCAWYCIY